MHPTVQQIITRSMREALGESFAIASARAQGGGDIHEAAVIETTMGDFFVKWHPEVPADLFAVEAYSLERLRAACDELTVPKPIAHRAPTADTPGFLVMEHLAPGQPAASFDETLGRGLAEMHRHTADAWGFARDTYCGTTPQPNAWRADWVAFYRDQRLAPLLERCAARRRLHPGDRAAFERLLIRLDDLLHTDEARPALIHGDLWRGNVHTMADGRPAILDPAAYFGHREAELGMMRLFGGFSARTWGAYREAWPLEPGFEQRLELYELYHLMNHYLLFGGSYGARAFAIARRWG